jgi:hypothetical protein
MVETIAVLVKEAFTQMVLSISELVTSTALPHLYHSSATTHEANSIYHFAKAIEQRSKPSAVYLEFQCDSGRVDAVIINRSAWLLVEAKSRLNNGKLGELESQAARLGNPDDSLRRYLSDKIPIFKKERWGVEGQDEIWGVLLAETIEHRWQDRWLSLPRSESYPTLRTYTYLAEQNTVYTAQAWYHLLAFKRVR